RPAIASPRCCDFVHRVRERKRKGRLLLCSQTETRVETSRVTGKRMGHVLNRFGRMLARYLEKPVSGYEPFTPSDPNALAASLRPGDVLLVEGNNQISGVIKYLTQSTWSHAALYVGPLDNRATDGETHTLIEAELGIGVDSAPLTKYTRFHTRVCRPVGLTEHD